MAYNIYTPQCHGSPLNHIALFVRHSTAAPEAGGKCFHVTGNILTGMQFEIRERESPLVAPDHVPNTMVLIGTFKEGDMVRFEDICRTVLPPGPQLKLNGKPKDPEKPLRRCGEWVEEVVRTLKGEGALCGNGGISARLENKIEGVLNLRWTFKQD